jgi:hypothetical protein
MHTYGRDDGLKGADTPDLLLSVEPDNMQAQSLRTLIEQSVTRDGYIGEYQASRPGYTFEI